MLFSNHIKLSEHLHNIDWLVLCATICLTIYLIIYGHRKKKTSSAIEYLLMGRQLTLPLFVATLVASWYGGVIGVTQIAFEQGIYNLFTQGVFWYITYIIFAVYLVKKIRSYNAKTLPDLVNTLYGDKSARLTAFFVFCKTLPITYAISIGILLQLLFPIPLVIGSIIGVGLVASYSAFGGLRSVVYSNLAQFILMCAGLSSVFFFSITTFGGLDFLRSNLPDTHFKICGTHTIATTLVWFFVACSTTFINPTFYQRCFAAKSTKTATVGIIISTVIWVFLDICTTFGAMYAKAVIPEADSLTAYITYSVQLLPIGFKGLLIASIFATIISTLDSYLFIASNSIYENNKPIRSTFLTAALTIFLSSFFNGNIEKIWLIYKSYFSACLLLPIIFGYIVPRLARDQIFYVSSVLSCCVMSVWELFFQEYGIDSFYIGCATSGIVFLVFYATLATHKRKISYLKNSVV